MAFEDIAIVDLELAKTSWSRVHSAMRTLYLRLSREPEIGWVRFFHEERESRVVIKRHGFWIEENYIVFDCLLEDVERYHLPDFRLSLEYANRAYRAWLEEQFEQGLLLREDARNERDELAAIRERIRLEASNADAALAPAVPSPLAAAAAAVPASQFAAPGAPLRTEQRIAVTIPEPPPAPVPSAEPLPVERTAAVNAPVRSHGLAARVAELLRHVGGPPPLPTARAPSARAPLPPSAEPSQATPAEPVVEELAAVDASRADDEPSESPPVAAADADRMDAEAVKPEALQTDPAETDLVDPDLVEPELAQTELALPEPAPAEPAPTVEPAPEMSAQALTPAAPAPEPQAAASPPSADSIEDGFNAKREEWRARFRAALAAQSKERNRGND